MSVPESNAERAESNGDTPGHYVLVLDMPSDEYMVDYYQDYLSRGNPEIPYYERLTRELGIAAVSASR